MDYSRILAKLFAEMEHDKTTDARRAELMSQIQRISTTYQIDQHAARLSGLASTRQEEPTTKRVILGEPKARGLKARVALMIAITGQNDIRVTIAHNSTFINLCGFPKDIETCESIYNSLTSQMIDAANTAIKKGDHKLERDFRTKTGYVDARVYRSHFYAGFTSRIQRRLSDARIEAIHAAKMAEKEAQVTAERINAGLSGSAGVKVEAPVGTDMVLRDKAKKVKDHFDSSLGKHSKGTWKGSSSKGYSSRGQESGSEAGRKARLRPQAELPSRRVLVGAGR
jgi:hypothetical protein